MRTTARTRIAAGLLGVTAVTLGTAGLGTPALAAGHSPSAPAREVLARINAVRAAVGAKPLAMRSALISSAHLHNVTMAAGCGLLHQCPGEARPSRRATAQGVAWNAFAENIGYGYGAGDAAKTAMAVRLTQSMIDEVGPGDGHRRNILNPSLGQIGIDVYRDASGRIWLTQDFTN